MVSAVLLFILVLILAITACSLDSPPPTNTTTDVIWRSDGVVTEGEYQSSKVISDTFSIWWNTDSTNLYMAMKGTSPLGPGFVSIGFLPPDWVPEKQKLNTDAIIGFVSEGKAYAIDVFIIGLIGPHPADSSNDVNQVSGTVDGNTTIIEFQRKLNTGDDNDQPLEKGLNKIMWAIGYASSDLSAHPERGYSEIELK